ncbi:MAG: HPr kinase/phosphorylase [Novosphingobium sp.]
MAAPQGSGAPGISISLGAQGQTSPEPQFSLDGEAIIYCNPAGNFRCFADSIEIAPGEPLDLEDLGTLLVANALPAVLWLRGAFMLHAACVRLADGTTVAIAGPSGAGKSRLAASLVEAGAQLIADDSVALALVDDRVSAAGLPGGWFARNPDTGRREFKQAPGEPAAGPASIDLLAILGDGDAATLSHPLAAFEALMQHRHRPQVPLLLGQQAQVLQRAARIAKGLSLAALPICNGPDEALAMAHAALDRLAREQRYGRARSSTITGHRAD